MKIGTRVRVTHNDAHDKGYHHIAIATRCLFDGKIGVVIDRNTAHGLSYRVSSDDGKLMAWFESDELQPFEYGINQVAMGCKPDPTNFKIVDLEHLGNCTIIIANYGGLTFGGDKLMVLRGIFNKDDIKVLDPHFLNSDHPVIARFQPTPEGFQLAMLVASAVNKMKPIVVVP